MSDNPTGRITSEEIRIEFFPRSNLAIAENHIQELLFDNAVDGGTFKLWVDGEVTGSISVVSLATGGANVFTGDTVNDELDDVAHGLIVGDRIVLATTGTLPAPLLINTVYYVVQVVSADSVKVSLTAGGSVIDITTTGTGTHTWEKQVTAIKTNINSALDALDILANGEIVATGTSIADVTLTASADNYHRILIHENLLTQTIPNTNQKLQTTVTQQGTEQFVLSAQASAFNWEGQSETVDMTAISEYDELQVAVKLAVNFEISLYKAQESWEFAIYPGTYGTFRVYPRGKIVGREYFQFRGLIETVGEDYPDHEKVERTISGMRQGNWHVPPNTVWKG